MEVNNNDDNNDNDTEAKHHLLSAWKCIPHFPSSSIPASVKFWTENLHFTLGGIHPDTSSSEQEEDEGKQGQEPTMASLFIGLKATANIYLFLQKNQQIHPSAAMIALGTKQLDLYYEILVREGRVEISSPIADMPWGYRQFEVRDGDGNRIQFFRFLEGGNPGRDGEDGGDASEDLL